MDFEIIGEITRIELIAGGSGVRVRLMDGAIRLAEIHCYEAHGIGRREFKLKLPFLDTP
jgi:hypothetical protein